MVGVSLSSVLRVIFKILKYLVSFIADVLYYFGLYVPLAYLVYGGVLYGVFKFEPFSLSYDSMLYLFGLGLCVIASVILTVKKLIIKPIREAFKKPDLGIKAKDGEERKPSSSSRSSGAYEAPVIYESKVNPGIIVYEYANRYDLYEQYDDDSLVLVNTEFKDRGRRR